MPYPAGHKLQTRRRILRSAAKLFAARGFQATSIDEVMRACGLTRGAFYAHFRSKAHLHEEAMREAALLALPADPRLAQGWADDVLGPLEASASRASALSGRWAFLAADIANGAPEVRAAYEAAVRHLVASAAGGRDAAAPLENPEAVGAVAMLVGTIAIACTVEDPAMRAAFVRACRDRLEPVESANGTSAGSGELLWAPSSGN